MKKIYFLVFFSTIVYGCNTIKKQQFNTQKDIDSTMNPIGFIVNNKHIQNPVFEIFDLKSNSRKTFTFTKKDDNIFPYCWNSEYYTLVFRCIKKDKNWYYIITDEKDKIIGRININDKNFNFQTVQEHILSSFSVSFNHLKNKLKITPVENSNNIEFTNDEFYLPVKISNEWLQVKWGNEKKWNYGWIKWKENQTLIIELYYY